MESRNSWLRAARNPAVAAAAALALSVCTDAQPATRRAANVAALVAYPDFFHARPVLIVGKLESKPNGDIEVSDGGATLRVVTKVASPEGRDEIRGELWDLGRMRADDPRLAGYDLRSTFRINPDTAWPRPGEMLALVATAISPAAFPIAPSIRSIVLDPGRYVQQRVTITGQYSGRNLLGDLPASPGKSRYDFVLRSADAAIWVSNVPPRGKDFEFALDARMETARWLQVSGTVQHARGLQWIDADAGSLTLTKAPADTVADEPIRVLASPPPEVVFSAPTGDETDVSPATNVRIQFSREINPASFKGRIEISYVDSQNAGVGDPPARTPEFTFQYKPGSRVLELKFARPLEQFRTLKIMLLDGIVGRDQQPLKPWTLTFALGGT